MIKLSDYIFKFIKDKGIKHAFILPGGGAMHLIDSIGYSGIDFVCMQHEQAAAIAAESYGQHTNDIGVVLVTSGPGATNAITGVTAGWIDSTPMFVISGQAKRSDLVGDRGVRQIGSQEVQIIDMIKPITKYAVQILEPNEIRYHMERAYYEARNGRPGPVWLDVPLDVQAAMVNEDEMPGFQPERTKREDISPQLQQVMKLIEESKQPLILAGNGIKLAGAADLFYELITTLQMPAITTWKTIDMMGEDDELYVGHPGIMGDRGANLILQSADLLISIGSRLDTSITAFNEKRFAKCAKKVIVDIDANEIARMNMDMEMGMVCDARDFLNGLLKLITKKSERNDFNHKWTEWIARCHSIRNQFPVVTKDHRDSKEYVSAYYFIDILCKNLNNKDIIVPESSGGAGEITYQAFKIKKGQKMKNAAGLGSMGFGLPYAIGACLANDKRRTILINGDGAFQLNIQELETLMRLRLPVKIFIWNNGGYASIRAMQRNIFEGHYVASDEDSGFTLPDISKVASAYGFKTYQIRTNDEMDRLLPIILEEDQASICELFISPEETVSPRVKAIRMPDGSMQSSPLERMWPEQGAANEQ